MLANIICIDCFIHIFRGLLHFFLLFYIFITLAHFSAVLSISLVFVSDFFNKAIFGEHLDLTLKRLGALCKVVSLVIASRVFEIFSSKSSVFLDVAISMLFFNGGHKSRAVLVRLSFSTKEFDV